MRRKSKVALATLIAVFATTVMASSAAAAPTGVPKAADLYAGQSTDVGDIYVWADSTNLYIEIDVTGGWCMTESHVAVAQSAEDIPQRNGNPVPGQFPYKTNYSPTCVTEDTYTIPLSDVGSAPYVIAVHAKVQTGDDIIRYESGWAGDLGFPGKNWATYFIWQPTLNFCPLAETVYFANFDITVGPETCRIPATTTVNGDITAAGKAVRVFGTVNGNITQTGGAGVFVESGGTVNGNITESGLQDVQILAGGTVNGNVFENDGGNLIVALGGTVNGDVTEAGAGTLTVNGTVTGSTTQS